MPALFLIIFDTVFFKKFFDDVNMYAMPNMQEWLIGNFYRSTVRFVFKILHVKPQV